MLRCVLIGLHLKTLILTGFIWKPNHILYIFLIGTIIKENVKGILYLKAEIRKQTAIFKPI